MAVAAGPVAAGHTSSAWRTEAVAATGPRLAFGGTADPRRGPLSNDRGSPTRMLQTARPSRMAVTRYAPAATRDLHVSARHRPLPGCVMWPATMARGARRGSSRLLRVSNGGGDDGNRTRVNGFADRSLTTRARRRAAGCPARIRTSVHGSKVRCPTTRRRGTESAGPSRAKKWSGRRDSNPRPSPWQGDALPTEPLPPVASDYDASAWLVPRVRIELTTPASSGRCSTD